MVVLCMNREDTAHRQVEIHSYKNKTFHKKHVAMSNGKAVLHKGRNLKQSKSKNVLDIHTKSSDLFTKMVSPTNKHCFVNSNK